MTKQKSNKNHWGRLLTKVSCLAILMVGGLYCGLASAGSGPILLTTVAKSIDSSVGQIATILTDISLIAGIGFIMCSFFKFHQHKLQPQQVSMSQGISLLLIGCGLTLVPILVPTASVAVLGSAASKPAQIGGDDIHNLIGSGG